MLDYDVVRQGDPTLGEPELTPAVAATQALSRQVAALGAPDGADAGDPGLVLGSFGIRWVLLPGPIDPALAQRLDAAVGLVLLSTSSSYDLWQVAGPVGRVRVVAPDGTVTVLASGPLGMSGVSAPAAGGTLVLAEPYGGWTATLNGRALRPITTPVDGWAQGFALPPGRRSALDLQEQPRPGGVAAGRAGRAARGLRAGAAGQTRRPAEEADALAALREARDAKRGARGQLRSGRAATEVAAADGADTAVPAAGHLRPPRRGPGVPASRWPAWAARPGWPWRAGGAAGRRRDDDFGAEGLPETVAVAEWPLGETASGPGVAGLAAQDFPDDDDEGQAPGDQGQGEHATVTPAVAAAGPKSARHGTWRATGAAAGEAGSGPVGR